MLSDARASCDVTKVVGVGLLYARVCEFPVGRLPYHMVKLWFKRYCKELYENEKKGNWEESIKFLVHQCDKAERAFIRRDVRNRISASCRTINFASTIRNLQRLIFSFRILQAN